MTAQSKGCRATHRPRVCQRGLFNVGQTFESAGWGGFPTASSREVTELESSVYPQTRMSALRRGM